MIAIRNVKVLIVAVLAACALAACDNQAPPSPPSMASPAKPATPAPQTPGSASAGPGNAAAATTLTAVELGKEVNASGNALVGAPSTTFAPKDTIYALVTTNSATAAPATIMARWTLEGNTLIEEGKHQVEAAGRSVTEFHISKPEGWPTGHYSVAISIDGKPAGSKDFEIK